MPDDTEDAGMLPESTVGPERTPGFSFNGPDIEKLVKTATAEPETKGLEDLLGRVKKIPERQESEVGPIREKFLGRLDTDQTRAEEKYKAISELDVKPWTQKPPEADPWKAFGSPGSVFAMVASAFTRTPMTNALNAGAAAMNAVRANDLQGYKSAFEAWKENTDLALKRHEIQYKDYLGAADLMKNNVAAGDAAMRAVNAKYGDEYAEALREAGLLGELDKLHMSRQNAAVQMLQAYPQLEGFGIRQEGYMQDPGRESEDPKVRNETYRKWFDPAYWHSIAGSGRGTTNPLTLMRAEAIEQKKADWQAANPGKEMDGATYAKIISSVMNPISGNKDAEYKTMVDQYENSLDKVDGVLTLLDNTIGTPGASGYAKRIGERLVNVFGGAESANAVQFMRDIELLRLNAARLLTASQGKPLASEAKRINDIIGGIGIGDTTLNTKRALEEYQTLMMKMMTDTISIIDGTWKPPLEKVPAAGAPAAKPAPAGAQPWLNDRKAGK